MIINTLPVTKGLFTHFMNGRASVLDYGLIDEDHVSMVNSFVIDSHARYSCGSDHALLEASITFGPHVHHIPWKYTDVLKYNFNANSDFTSFKKHLDSYLSSIPISQFANLSTKEMLFNLTEWLNKAGKDSFGLKVPLKKKRGRRLPPDILKLIKIKNEIEELYQTALVGTIPEEIERLSSELKKIKADLQLKISKMKLKQRNYKRNNLLKNDPTRKKFWSFLRTRFKKTGSLSGCYDKHGKRVFKQEEIEAAIVDHFTDIFKGRKEPPSSDSLGSHSENNVTNEEYEALCGDEEKRCSNEFEKYVCSSMTITELQNLLNKLPKGKSSGYDFIPNEFLINSSIQFQQYLVQFYNKIIEDGLVPEELNIGKCVLIHKVFT